jgi:signal transduction histidine kinase
MYVNVILGMDASGERPGYGRAVASVRKAGPPRPPLLYGLSGGQWVALDAVAALFGFLVTELDLRPIPGQTKVADAALALFACAPVALRRRWPIPALVVVTAAVAGLTFLGRSQLPISAMLSLAGYTVATRVSRRSSIAALVGAEAVLCVGLWSGIALGRARGGSVGAEAVQSFLPLVAAWFVGDSVAARRAYVGGLASQAEQQRVTDAERARQVIREERIQIARELHDVVAHSLAVITVQAGVGRRLMNKRPEEAGTALESIEATGRTAQDELRVVLGLLCDDDTERAELAPAPGLADLNDLVETVRAAGTPVELRTSGTARRLSPALELSIYRIVQEALTNVVKHAPGARATVDFAVSDRGLSIEVADDGDEGIDRPPAPASAQSAQPGSQLGIVGMQERVGAFGGSLVAEAVAGHGFRVTARIPLKDGP